MSRFHYNQCREYPNLQVYENAAVDNYGGGLYVNGSVTLSASEVDNTLA